MNVERALARHIRALEGYSLHFLTETPLSQEAVIEILPSFPQTEGHATYVLGTMTSFPESETPELLDPWST